jgi:hypothetical protein
VDSVKAEGDFATVDDVRQHCWPQRDGADVLSEQNLMCARNEDLCQLDEPVERWRRSGVFSDRDRRLSHGDSCAGHGVRSGRRSQRDARG